MQTNDCLGELCRRLSGIEPDWDKIVETFLELNEAKLGTRYSQFHQYVGDLTEIHLALSLETVSSDLPILLTARVPYKSDSRYYFRQHAPGKIEVRSYGSPITEYDNLAIVDTLPVVFEITLANYNRDSRGRIRFPQELRHKVTKRHYDKRFKPLETHFERDIGCVVIVGKHLFDLEEFQSLTEIFRQEKGHVLPLYANRAIVYERVHEVISQQGWPLKE